jgi:peptidyl-dipeptidase Dcp
MYRAFTGHDPEIQPYLDYYGLAGGTAVPAPVPAPLPEATPSPTERGK